MVCFEDLAPQGNPQREVIGFPWSARSSTKFTGFWDEDDKSHTTVYFAFEVWGQESACVSCPTVKASSNICTMNMFWIDAPLLSNTVDSLQPWAQKWVSYSGESSLEEKWLLFTTDFRLFISRLILAISSCVYRFLKLQECSNKASKLQFGFSGTSFMGGMFSSLHTPLNFSNTTWWILHNEPYTSSIFTP